MAMVLDVVALGKMRHCTLEFIPYGAAFQALQLCKRDFL
jgi:hypothetical protein